MKTSWNWLQGDDQQQDGPSRGQAMPVFAGQKLVVVGGSSGMGRQTAADVVAAGGSAVIIGQDPGKVDDTVQALAKEGSAYGITADLTDRMQAEEVCRQLAAEHADASLLVNAAGLFIPTAFLDYDGAAYDSYLELDRAIFFLTQTVARGMIQAGRGGSIVNVGSMWAHQAIGATPSSGYSVAKGGLHALTHNLALELAPHQIRVRPRPGQHHHLPALPGHQLGHRRHLERRRRRHGRTQLTNPGRPCAGPATRRTRHARPQVEPSHLSRSLVSSWLAGRGRRSR